MIKAEIASLKKSSRFIDYYESDDFATKIDQLRMHIARDLLPRFPNHAVDLLTAFLDLHPKTLNRVDDSNGVIGDVFIKACADLANAYAAVTTSLDGNPPQKQLPKGVEFSRNKEGDSINDNIKTQ